ncbi:histidine kinase, partial [Streptomyces sp. NPDC056159]
EPATGEPADEEPTDEEPTDEESVSEEPADEEPASPSETTMELLLPSPAGEPDPARPHPDPTDFGQGPSAPDRETPTGTAAGSEPAEDETEAAAPLPRDTRAEGNEPARGGIEAARTTLPPQQNTPADGEAEAEHHRTPDAPEDEVTAKGLPKRTPKISAPAPAPRQRSASVDAEALRRRLGGFHRGAREGYREAEAEAEIADQNTGGTVEEASS